MYQALYRKWRPQTFDEVVGQSHITETLKNQVKNNRLSHAYIFIGTRGTGKTTCARILAKAVNCENPVNGNPCCKCAACRGIADGSVLDVVELDAASNNGVDNVRTLREEALFSPAEVKKRVYIIDEVHMLSTSAFNALLKILEEPPEHLMFILATTELQKVPPTILSRCQRHSFRRIDVPQLSQYLEYIAKKESFDLTSQAAGLIARLADGGVRDALSLLDQCSAYEKIDVDAVYSAMGLTGNRRISETLDNILRHDTEAALNGFASLWMDGKDPATFLKELDALLRDILIAYVAPKSGKNLLTGGYDSQLLESFKARMTKEELISAMDTVMRYTARLREAKNPRTVVELCLISLCDSTLGEDIGTLRARISRLEAMASNGSFVVTANNPATVPDRPAFDAIPNAAPSTAANPPEVKPASVQTTPSYAEESKAPVQTPAATEDPIPQPDVQIEAAAPENADLWPLICKEIAPQMAPDLKYSLDDPSKLRASVQNDVIKVECMSGFVYGRFNKHDVIDLVANAAGRITGREMHVMVSQASEEDGKTRNVEELRQFKEVRFI